MKITCSQFENLLSFYMNNDLSDALKTAFEEHMKECNYCREKYAVVHSIVDNIKDAYNQFIYSDENGVGVNMTKYAENRADKNENSDMYDDYNNVELSAYIDNELPDDRSIKIRRSIGSRPKVRKKIERLYKLRKIMHNCQIEAKNSFRTDYSIAKVHTLNENYTQRKTYMHCLIFIMLVVASAIASLWMIIHLI